MTSHGLALIPILPEQPARDDAEVGCGGVEGDHQAEEYDEGAKPERPACSWIFDSGDARACGADERPSKPSEENEREGCDVPLH